MQPIHVTRKRSIFLNTSNCLPVLSCPRSNFYKLYNISQALENMPSTSAQETKSCITIKGSADIVCEYLNFGINSILFQRGIYPPEQFKASENYEVPMYMSEDPKMKDFLNATLTQLKEWLVMKKIDKVSLVIVDVNTKEPLERWDFKVEYVGTKNKDGKEESDKSLKQIQKEIRDVMKQIASSIAYLPLLDTRCSIDLLMYTNEKEHIEIPALWEEAPSADIKNAQTVALRSFSTNIHRVNTAVVYKSD